MDHSTKTYAIKLNYGKYSIQNFELETFRAQLTLINVLPCRNLPMHTRHSTLKMYINSIGPWVDQPRT